MKGIHLPSPGFKVRLDVFEVCDPDIQQGARRGILTPISDGSFLGSQPPHLPPLPSHRSMLDKNVVIILEPSRKNKIPFWL